MDEEKLKQVFEALDPESKGTIPADQFMKSLKIFGSDNAFQDEELEILKKEMGMEASGQFNYREFLLPKGASRTRTVIRLDFRLLPPCDSALLPASTVQLQ